ncbi:MAG TPA: hypothetical protein VM122_08555 [Usitatibacter sp.]|nr:hypothetical protein [Usitatibacter sp.]
MPSLSSLARRVSDRARGTAFERALARAPRAPGSRFLFFWNRGMGDIALGLVPLFARIRAGFPGAHITVITREELRLPMSMAEVDAVHVLPGLEREARPNLSDACRTLGLEQRGYAAVFSYPDPNRWLEGRRRDFPPRLRWDPAWDRLADAVAPPSGRIAIGAHVSSETASYYGYRKDWPAASWQALFDRFPAPTGVEWLLLGKAADAHYRGDNVTDLRGRTDFPSLLAVIRHRLRALVAPDSGILTTAYYLDASFPLAVVSLWGDPRQGVLHQGCASPNPLLTHHPLVAPGEDIAKLEVADVAAALLATSVLPPR